MKRFFLALLFSAFATLAAAQTGDVSNPQTNASALTTGTLPAGRMPALTGDITSSAGTVATTLATGNAGNLNSGTLLAARMPALTGDTTTSVGTVATTTTGINGVNMNAAWATYVPTATCTAGTITTDTVAGRYRFIGTKTLIVNFNVNISTLGTCTGNVTLSLPPSGTVNGSGQIYPGNALNLSLASPVAVPVYAGSSAAGIVMVFAAAPAANNYFGVVTYEVN